MKIKMEMKKRRKNHLNRLKVRRWNSAIKGDRRVFAANFFLSMSSQVLGLFSQPWKQQVVLLTLSLESYAAIKIFLTMPAKSLAIERRVQKTGASLTFGTLSPDDQKCWRGRYNHHLLGYQSLSRGSKASLRSFLMQILQLYSLDSELLEELQFCKLLTHSSSPIDPNQHLVWLSQVNWALVLPCTWLMPSSGYCAIEESFFARPQWKFAIGGPINWFFREMNWPLELIDWWIFAFNHEILYHFVHCLLLKDRVTYPNVLPKFCLTLPLKVSFKLYPSDIVSIGSRFYK